MKEWFIANYQWTILVLLSLTTIVIAISIAKKQSIKNKTNILHDKRLKFYAELRKYYELVIGSPYNTTFNDFSREELFNSKFYFKGIHKEINKFICDCDSINKLKEIANKLFSFIISSNEIAEDERNDFREVVNGFHAGNKKYTIESLRAVSDMCVVKNISLDEEKAQDYNYYELYMERKNKKEKLKEEYNKLSSKIENSINQ